MKLPTDNKKIKDFKDENTIDVKVDVTDVTPGFGSNAVLQKTYNRGFRFLGALNGRPGMPRNGDAIYNTATKKLEVYYRQFYSGFGVPNINLTGPILYMEGDYAEFNGELWRAVADGGPGVPSQPDWVRDNQISGRAEPGPFYARNFGTLNVNSGVETDLGDTSDTIVTNDQSVVDNFSITLPRDGNYLVIGSAIVNNVNGDAVVTLRNRIFDGVSNIISTDIYDLPTITVTTTGTDSMGGAINANSTVSIGIIPELTLETTGYIINGGAGDIITTTLEHNNPAPLSATGGFTIIQI